MFYAKKGDNLKAKVLLHGKPFPEVEWKRDGADVKQTSRVNLDVVDDSAVLTIKGQ